MNRVLFESTLKGWGFFNIIFPIIFVIFGELCDFNNIYDNCVVVEARFGMVNSLRVQPEQLNFGDFKVYFLCRISPTFVGRCPFYKGDCQIFGSFLVKYDNQSESSLIFDRVVF